MEWVCLQDVHLHTLAMHLESVASVISVAAFDVETNLLMSVKDYEILII